MARRHRKSSGMDALCAGADVRVNADVRGLTIGTGQRRSLLPRNIDHRDESRSMAATAKKTDPKLWETVKDEITRGEKGGDPGEWSARKAQMAVQEYKKRGGGYEGRKTEDNHLRQWQEEEWGTKSGKKSKDTGERYLPKAARGKLSDEEYKRTTAKKRADTRKGQQFSAQPKDVAEKTASARKTSQARSRAGEATKAELMGEARRKGVEWRSRMSKAELERAVRG
jgi:hypothetical protein